MSNYLRNSFLIGSAAGVGLTYLMFTNVPWYHDLLIWSWTNPWMWVAAVPAGFLAAVLTD